MLLSPNPLYREIKKISGYHSLLIARYFLLLSCLAAFFYYFAHHYGLYCTYIAILSLFAPSILEHTLQNKKPNSHTVILPTLKKSYAYDSKKYICQLITFWLSNILLIAWQFSTVLHPTLHFIANYFPSFILLGNIVIYLFLLYYYQIKLHSQLLNNRW